MFPRLPRACFPRLRLAASALHLILVPMLAASDSSAFGTIFPRFPASACALPITSDRFRSCLAQVGIDTGNPRVQKGQPVPDPPKTRTPDCGYGFPRVFWGSSERSLGLETYMQPLSCYKVVIANAQALPAGVEIELRGELAIVRHIHKKTEIEGERAQTVDSSKEYNVMAAINSVCESVSIARGFRTRSQPALTDQNRLNSGNTRTRAGGYGFGRGSEIGNPYPYPPYLYPPTPRVAPTLVDP
ncbi:hypothetical protein BKA70DRAFT_1242471 [Coprinopsis sp. MPI-PUGE-AT-0042]|nr:hypothetical protein BKA70DRAFT_1242471 [Coprinopsis sp. MPI-PUGE-AT-0042]